MNFQKVLFAFFILLALTVNFGFVVGQIDVPAHHNVYELFAAIVVNLIATVMKFGERSHISNVLLATSLVADLQLLCSALVWGYAAHVSGNGAVTPADMAVIVSLASGALIANLVSVILLMVETVTFRR